MIIPSRTTKFNPVRDDIAIGKIALVAASAAMGGFLFGLRYRRLWRAVGFTQDDALAITVITSVTNIVVTFVATALIDRLGRRPASDHGLAGDPRT